MSQGRQHSPQDQQKTRRHTPDNANNAVHRVAAVPDVRQIAEAAGDRRLDRPVRQGLVQQLGATVGNQVARRLLDGRGLIQRDDLSADEPLVEKRVELELTMETADFLRVRFPRGTARDAVRRVYFGNPNNEATIISFQAGRAAAKISQGQYGLGIYADVALPQFIWDRQEATAIGNGAAGGQLEDGVGQADNSAAVAQDDPAVAPEEPAGAAAEDGVDEEPAGNDISAMTREQLVAMVQSVRDKDDESKRQFHYVGDQQLNNERRFSKEALRALYLKLAAVSDDADAEEAHALYEEISRGRWHAE
ncbi:MAG: hypothetical protein KDE28_16175 [Anaerolineales bacterium]|nr:hypothetical protein [Anaerolineales bacterium]